MKKTLAALIIAFCFSQTHSHPKLEVVEFNNVKYVTAMDYANQSNMNHLFVADKDKLIVQYKAQKITISPNSSYISVNNSIYNLSIPTIYDGNDFWLPINSFSRIIQAIGLPDLKLDSSEKFILLTIFSNIFLL